MIFLDTETCGLHGVIVLIQYAEDDGPIEMFSPWTSPIHESITLIEKICNEEVVGFNLAFDWFHINKLYNIFVRHPDWSHYPIDHVNELALLESGARDGLCLKPKSAMDLMLHARKGPYQSTMDRGTIRIRRIPTPLAKGVRDELETKIPLKDIYFARRKKEDHRWKVMDIEKDEGGIDYDFKDIVLKFAPSSALKALAADALVDKDILNIKDVGCNVSVNELGYAPFAEALGSEKDWKGTWPDVVRFHVEHWAYNTLARKYASDDIDYTRGLYYHFDSPDLGDDDSVLACMVGAVRWKGFKINKEKLEKLKIKAAKTLADFPISIATAPHIAYKFISQHMDETEKLIMGGSTKAVIIEEIATWEADDGSKHPAAIASQTVIDARSAYKRMELIDKLLLAGRFHASFKVIGTLSSRMAGADGLNAQGIDHTTEVRECFDLAPIGMQLLGGDFDSFEVVLAEAEYKDPKLRRDLMAGKSIHALFGTNVFPELSYEGIIETKGTDDDKYLKSKSGVFALLYGGEAYTLSNRLGVDEETADEAYQKFIKTYQQVGVARRRVFDMFCSMRQPKGIGTAVEWHEPSEYIESMLGFRRYFTLENRICKTLFDLANKPPKEWSYIKLKVTRRDRLQTAAGACRSAIFGAAFQIQASNMRAAANHVIQSSGATITKHVERRIWDVQPIGISEWVVMPMNIHDEVMSPTKTDYVETVDTVVRETVESYREKVPLISITWKNDLKNWAGK